MNLSPNSKLFIPQEEIQWRFSRSSGPGGQKVNKSESRVEIVFNIRNSKSLTSYQKFHLIKQLKNKLINDCICIIVQERRTQYENRRLALSKLTALVKKELTLKTRKRIATKPTKGSKMQRIVSKKRRGSLKRSRQSKIDLDE